VFWQNTPVAAQTDIATVEFAMPLENGKSGIGLHYTNNREAAAYGADSDNYGINYKSTWWTLSYGEKINDKFAVGVNIRQEKESVDGIVEAGVRTLGKSSNTTYSTDLGLLYQASDKLSYGLLIQDASGRGKEGNWRPAVAYRPDNKTIVAFDVYNATEAYNSTREYSIGIEHKFSDKVAIRVGNYHGSMTYGAGISIDKDVEINVAHLAKDLGGTNLIGVQTKF